MEHFVGRLGFAFPLSKNPEHLLSLLDAQQIKFILNDKKKKVGRQFLLPVIEAYPDRFSLVRDKRLASLYKVH